jgi:hypothetical protein
VEKRQSEVNGILNDKTQLQGVLREKDVLIDSL